MEFAINYILIPLIKIALILAIVPGYVALITYAERKIIAFMQVRLGPMRVGPWGLLQMVADPLKLLLKEDIVPAQADRWIFTLAPVMCLIPAFIVLAVIPVGSSFSLLGRQITYYVTDLNIGVLYVLSVSSVGILGIILAGWASNSKYPLLGALRSAAQMVSYEVALGFSIIGVLMLSGSLSLVSIVEAQKSSGFWYVFLQPIGFLLFFICGVAETNRAPFDLPEAESELVAGFHTEYSGFRFSLFFLAEYANMLTVAAMAVTLFWGGWLRPFPNIAALSFLDFVPGPLWFLAKVIVFLYFYLWFRASWPRYRYDQLMKLGWQYLLPIAIANLIVTAVLMVVLGRDKVMKVKRPELSFLKKIFLVDLIKGLFLTFSYQRPSKNYTEQYPKERAKIAERFRGAPRLNNDPVTGETLCIACNLCALACPEHCIEVGWERDPAGKKALTTYIFDVSRCMFCGLCEDACPTPCLELTQEFELSLYGRRDMKLNRQQLEAGVQPVVYTK